MLEVHLRYVRSFLRDAAHKVSPELRADFENVLQKISTVASESSSPPDASESSHQAVMDEIPGYPNLSETTTRSSDVLQAVSQQSFLRRISQLASGAVNIGNESSAITALFSLPLPEQEAMSAAALPSRRRAMVLIDALFDCQLPLLAFLHERYFRDMVDMLYETDFLDEGVQPFRPLLHFALALGCLFLQTDHETDECQQAQTEAMQHYMAGQALLQPLMSSNLTALQTVLCAVVFLLSTCRMTMAHPLIGLACSLALRLGLHAKNANLPAEEQLFRARACTAVLHMDILASLVLGLPPFIQQREVDLSVFDHLASEAYQHGHWQTVASVAQLKLLFACRSNEDAALSSDATKKPYVQQTAIKEGGARLKGWREHVATLLEDLQDQGGGSE